jgi:hypothetical protein
MPEPARGAQTARRVVRQRAEERIHGGALVRARLGGDRAEVHGAPG